MKEMFGYICIAGFVISVLYAVYSMFIKKSGPGSAEGIEKDETVSGRVRESSRLLEARPEMSRETESDIEVEPVRNEYEELADDKEAEDSDEDGDEFEDYTEEGDDTSSDERKDEEPSEAEQGDDSIVGPEEAEEIDGEEEKSRAGKGSDKKFLRGLDEDLESKYEERQPLSDYAEAGSDSGGSDAEESLDALPEAEVAEISDDESDEEKGTDRHENVRDFHKNEYIKGGIDPFSETEPSSSESDDEEDDGFEKPTPLDISQTFHRLEDKAETERQENDDRSEDADNRDESERDGSLFD